MFNPFKMFGSGEAIESQAARVEPVVVPAVHNDTPAPSGSTRTVSLDELADIFLMQTGIAPESPDRAMRLSAVYACVRLLGGAVASMPVEIYKREGAARSVADNNPIWWLLNEEPCPMFSAPMAWEFWVTSQCFYGDAFALIVRNKRNPYLIDELIPLDPRLVWIRIVNRRYTYVISLPVTDGEEMIPIAFDQDDILHFTGPGFNPRTGRSMSVLQYAASRAAPIARHAEELADRAFTRGNIADVVLTYPKAVSKDQREQLIEQYRKKHSGLDNLGTPLVLAEGGEVNQLKMTAADAQLLESRSFQVIDIARAFGVPPFMIGEMSKTTSWGSGVSEMGRGFVLYSVQPYLNRMQAEINRKVFRTARYFAEFDPTPLTRADPAADALWLRQVLGGQQGPGLMSVDEVRARRNLPPRGGPCDAVYFPPAGPGKSQTDTSPNADPPDGGPGGGEGNPPAREPALPTTGDKP